MSQTTFFILGVISLITLWLFESETKNKNN